jgi:hypothetical protein
MLNKIPEIFSSQKEKNKNRIELPRRYMRESSVISKD